MQALVTIENYVPSGRSLRYTYSNMATDPQMAKSGKKKKKAKSAQPKFEDMLRSGMQKIGSAVEKVIGKAREAKQSVSLPAPSTQGDYPPSLEGLLTVPKVRELLRLSVDRMIPNLLPALTDRRAFELADGVGKYAPRMKDHGAKMVVATEIGAGMTNPITDAVNHVYMLRAAIYRLPFEDNVFDFGVANLLTPYQGNVMQAFKEISRVMAPGGTIIITDFHPFGSYAKRGTARVKPVESSFRGLADYYKAARLSGMRVTDIRESFVDETVRALFVTDEEKQIYRTLRDTPLILCMIAKKGTVFSENAGDLTNG